MSAYKTASTLSGATGITGTGRSALLKLSATIVLLWVVGTAVAENPVAPVVTSSPRSTLKSFLDLTDEATRLLSEYRRAPSSEIQARARSLGDKAAELLDLSQVPPVSRPEVADTTLYLLWDVIARVPLPELDQIPGQPSDAAADEQDKLPARWSIPGTDITIGRINEGPQAGEYLFTADTVQRARSFYAASRGLPYQRPMPLGDVYRHSLT
jgi:MscS family membrane protein